MLVAPRAGYVVRLGERTELWLRGGITYFTSAADSSSNDFHGLSLNLEPKLVFAAAPHFGVTVGAVIDVGLSGGSSDSTASEKYSNYGLDVGIAGWL